jgi:hypothetical protein
MKVRGYSLVDVDVDPSNVLLELMKTIVHDKEWLDIQTIGNDNVYVIMGMVDAGNHSYEKVLRVISEEEWEFYGNLKAAYEYLKEKK